jgi:glucose-1-phosphate thymidylyltransferase
VVKGLVLSGGTGSRLRPITYTSAKQLVPIANKPILFYGLESLARAGVVEVAIVVGDTAVEVMSAVGDGSAFGLEVTYIRQSAPLGLAHCVRIAEEYLGDEDFVMYLGDNFILDGVEKFIQSFRDRDPSVVAQILLAQVSDPQRFGVAVLDESGRVTKLIEKPEIPPSDLALVGVYLFDKTIHGAVSSIEPSPRGELEITDAIDWLLDQGANVRSSIVEGYWKDLGEPEALLDGNRLALDAIEPTLDGHVDVASRIEGRVCLGEGAEIINSLVRGPAIIGAGSKVVDSFIGPYTSVGPRCEILQSEVEYSIVLADSKVHDIVRLEGSVLGKGVRVSRRKARPSASRLVIGDNSIVEIDRS